VRIRCEGVSENVVFSGDYKGSMQRFWKEEDDINSDHWPGWVIRVKSLRSALSMISSISIAVCVTPRRRAFRDRAPILFLSSAVTWPAKAGSADAILDIIRPVNNVHVCNAWTSMPCDLSTFWCISANLADSLRLLADMNSWRRLRSASSSTLLVCHPPVAPLLATSLFRSLRHGRGNSLPSAVRDAATLWTFRQHLNTYLSRDRFYPRDAMLARSLRQQRVCPSVCLSVCYMPVLCLAERKQDREMYTVW